jgi:hypothetical protein
MNVELSQIRPVAALVQPKRLRVRITGERLLAAFLRRSAADKKNNPPRVEGEK